MLQLASLSKPVSILLTIILLFVSAGLIILFYFLTKKERNRFKESKLNHFNFNDKEFDAFIHRKLNNINSNTHFSIIQIEINDAEGLKSAFGDVQYNNSVDILIDRIKRNMDFPIKACKYSDNTLKIYIKNVMIYREVSNLLNMIILESKKPIILAGALKIELGINMGLITCPEGGKTFDEITNNLELCIIVAKRKGLNNFIIHNREINNSESEEYKNYLEVKSAIENKEFTLHYQPIINAKTNEIFGFESLLRWEHKTLGVLPPNKFLKILEHSGDIMWVGFWAFEQLALQFLEWKKKNSAKNIVLSFNLSPAQLVNPKLVEEFRRILRKYNIAPNNVCLEIIEFAMWDKMEVVRSNISGLKETGFIIALDDYGLEMGTFKMLEEIKIDIIKLEKEFMTKAENSFMAKNILDMLLNYAKTNGILLVAEGVETKENYDYVKNSNIDLCQGYYFGKPISPKEVDLNKSYQ